MASPTGSYLLVRNKRHSIRLRVPFDLVPGLGRGEIVRALGTADGRSARFIVAGVAIRLGRFWAMIRKKAPLTPEELRRIADDWLRAALADQWNILERGDFADAMAPAGMDGDRRRAFSAEMFGRDANHTADQVADEALRGQFRRFDSEAGQVLAGIGHGERRGTIERAVLSRLMLEGFADLQQSKIAWAEGDVAALPPQLVPIGPASMPRTPSAEEVGDDPTSAASASSRSVAIAVELFIARMRQNKATAKQIIEAQSDLKLLVEAFGSDRRVAQITPNDAGRLCEALRSLPPRFRSRQDLAGLDIFERAAKSRELALPPLSFRTTNSYLGTLRNLFDQEVMAGQVSTNPFVGKRETKPTRYVEQDRTLRPDELGVLFGCPLFQGAKSKLRPYDTGDYLIDDWMFWAPLIALLTGARIGEIAQLRPDDIRVVEDVAVVDINENGSKTLKNPSTARLIPVHSQLAAIGLVRLAAQQRAIKARLLLPSMPGPVLGDPGKGPSAWMSERLLRRLNLKTRAGLGFHSLRHTLKTLLRNAHVPDSISNELCGHDDRGSKGVGARYGRIEIGAMKSGLEKITIPEAIRRIKPRCLVSLEV